MRGKGKSGATTAAKENAVNTVAKKAESTIEAVAEKAKAAKAAKEELKPEVFIQYHGKQIDEKALLERVMQDCGEDKISVEDLKLYVKPEDNACYYVANGNVAGKVDLY